MIILGVSLLIAIAYTHAVITYRRHERLLADMHARTFVLLDLCVLLVRDPSTSPATRSKAFQVLTEHAEMLGSLTPQAKARP